MGSRSTSLPPTAASSEAPQSTCGRGSRVGTELALCKEALKQRRSWCAAADSQSAIAPQRRRRLGLQQEHGTLAIALWMVSGGCRCLKPPSGARLQLVTNLSRLRCSSCDGAMGGCAQNQRGYVPSRSAGCLAVKAPNLGGKHAGCSPCGAQRRLTGKHIHLGHAAQHCPKVLDCGAACRVAVAGVGG